MFYISNLAGHGRPFKVGFLSLTMEILEFSLVAGISSAVSIAVYVVIERIFCQGYATQRQLRQVKDLAEEAHDNLDHFRAKYSVRAGREQRAENNEQLKAMLPEIINKLPISDEQKAVIAAMPPDILLGLLKKYVRI